MGDPIWMRRTKFWVATGFTLALLALLPLFYRVDPYHINLDAQFRPPGFWVNPLGTDQYGRDVFARCLSGSQSALAAALSSTLVAGIAGLGLGGAGGYFGHRIDSVINLILKAVLAIPGILIPLCIIASIGVGSQGGIIGVSIILTPIFARIIRRAVMNEKAKLYVEASRALGASDLQIVLRHIIPNCAGAIGVGLTTTFAWSILNLISLDYLGLISGVSDPTWGRMIAEGRAYLNTAPWISGAPSVCIVLILLIVTRFTKCLLATYPLDST